ncbi:MAG: LPS-assembly protein LptD [Chthoniobacterales bacterium]
MMHRFSATLLLFACAIFSAQAQFGSFGDSPVEITADGETRFEGGVAVAEDNVRIHYGEVSIYCDYAEYNPDSRDVLLVGNIRLYSPEAVLTGQRALYNLETKQMRALEMSGAAYPMLFRAFSMRAPSLREFRATNSMITTDDSSEPDYYIRSRTVRIYPDDRVVFLNSTLYVRKVPVFWLPYLYSSLTETGFSFLPGYDSRWGAFLLTTYGFPIGTGENFIGRVHVDERTKQGFALGFDLDLKFGKDNRSQGEFLSYYAFDNDGGDPGDDKDGRYRVTYKQHLFLTDDIYATADINLLSDSNFMEDFFPTEFRTDPQPDNYVALTKWDENYTMNLLTRWQVNDFYEFTERLPEGVIDIKQHRLFGWPVFYTGEISAGYYRRSFAEGSPFSNYESARFDMFHQFSAPVTLFGWLNLIPKAGFRLTAYNRSGTFEDFSETIQPDPLDPLQPVPATQQIFLTDSMNRPTPALNKKGSVIRPVFNFGLDSSFKISRTYENIQSRLLGLDGIRHIIQPYTKLSFLVNAGADPDEILQFDRVVPSTQLLPLELSQFTAVDSIDTWAIMRIGVRNRLQTRRDNSTHEWLTWDTFLDLNFQNPYTDQDVSNLFNIISFKPLPWVAFDALTQFPLVDEGFTEVDMRIRFMPTRNLMFSFGPQIINGNENFADSSQFNFYAYWQINDNWGFSIYEQYEAEQDLLLYQRYMIHRDLSSWVASFGTQIRKSQGQKQDIGVLFVLTLKDAPQVTLPLAFDTGTEALGPGSSND